MPHFHFHIQENGRLIPDDEGQELDDAGIARKEAIATGASIARDAFIAGSASRRRHGHNETRDARGDARPADVRAATGYPWPLSVAN